MRPLVVIIIFIFTQTLSHAQKYDQQWPFGWGATREQSFGISILDFNSDEVDLYYHMPANRPSRLSTSSSFVCDKNGQFLLGTDNCRIFDHKMITIEGGTDMNPGDTNDVHCEQLDYPSFYGSLILPEVTNDTVFYIVHGDAVVDPIFRDVHTKNLYLSIVVRRVDNSFYLKEKIILFQENLIKGRLTGILNKEDNKWWVIFTGHNSDKYFRFKIGGAEKHEGPFEQTIGPVQIVEEALIFQAAFSPDGSMYAVNNTIHGLMLFDFDVDTGEFSNYRNVEFPNMIQHNGICFSPNSKLAYVTTAENLYQIDIETEEVIHIAHHWEPGEDGWPVGIGFLNSGPDCRIYISPATTNFYLHTILYPDRKGKDCGFVLRAFRTPTNLDFGIPNLPQYRYSYGCDSTLQFPITSSTDIKSLEPTVSIFPNPASDVITIDSPIEVERYILLDIHGRKVKEGVYTGRIEINSLQSGTYILQLIDKEKRVLSGRVMKI